MSECRQPDTSISVDVCIAGGGPAGSALALRLAQFGHSVAIVEKAAFPREHIGESLTTGVLPLLETLGLRTEIESAGFLAADWATVGWAGDRRRYRTSAGGLQVDRARFDSILLSAASAASSIRLYQPCGIMDRTFNEAKWRVRLNTGQTVYASYLADAAGRSRILGGTKVPIGAPTLGIYAYWKDVDVTNTDTLVEAGAAAWYWGVPLPNGRFNATVFVNPKQGGSREYLELLRSSSLIWQRIRNSAICGGIRTCDATPYLTQSPITRHSIHTGDAALSIDPLSSQGVQTAIGISLHAAVVLNTMIDRPEDEELAMQFYQSRLEDSASFHAAAARCFYQEQYKTCGGDFWCRRAGGVAQEQPQRKLPLSLHSSSVIRVALPVEFVTVPVVNGSRVAREDGIKFNARKIAYVGNAMPVAPLLRDIDKPMLANEVVRRWSRRMPREQALEILKWTWVEGLTEAAPDLS